jgi:hypothetical protein
MRRQSLTISIHIHRDVIGEHLLWKAVSSALGVQRQQILFSEFLAVFFVGRDRSFSRTCA